MNELQSPHSPHLYESAVVVVIAVLVVDFSVVVVLDAVVVV